MKTIRRAVFLAPLLCALGGVTLGSWAAATTHGSGTSATESRALSDFQAIGVSGSMDLVVRQGTPQAVQVQADANLLPLLETVVENGAKGPSLQVRWKKGESVYPKSQVVVTVVVPRLTALAVAGSGDVRVETFETPALQLSLSGSGDARLDRLTTAELVVRVAGSGDVSGNGSAGKLQVRIAGSGDVRMKDLRADEVSVSIAGSGGAAVQAQKTLAVSIAGSGDVTYSGNPSVKSSVAGSGSVSRN